MELGERPLEAALNGAAEIGFTILSMTLSLAAVFIPVLFMPGVLGRLFHEFAVTICAAILISGVVSLTLTPMLCGRYLRPPSAARHGRFYQATERFFDALLRGYERSLGWVLRHRPAVMGLSLLLLIATGWLFVRIPGTTESFRISSRCTTSIGGRSPRGLRRMLMPPWLPLLMRDMKCSTFVSAATIAATCR